MWRLSLQKWRPRTSWRPCAWLRLKISDKLSFQQVLKNFLKHQNISSQLTWYTGWEWCSWGAPECWKPTFSPIWEWPWWEKAGIGGRCCVGNGGCKGGRCGMLEVCIGCCSWLVTEGIGACRCGGWEAAWCGRWGILGNWEDCRMGICDGWLAICPFGSCADCKGCDGKDGGWRFDGRTEAEDTVVESGFCSCFILCSCFIVCPGNGEAVWIFDGWIGDFDGWGFCDAAAWMLGI